MKETQILKLCTCASVILLTAIIWPTNAFAAEGPAAPFANGASTTPITPQAAQSHSALLSENGALPSEAELKALINHNGLASAVGADASYLLCSLYRSQGRYRDAIREATALLAALPANQADPFPTAEELNDLISASKAAETDRFSIQPIKQNRVESLKETLRELGLVPIDQRADQLRSFAETIIRDPKASEAAVKVAKDAIADATADYALARLDLPPLDARYIVCLAYDLQGNLWIGTEDEGVWRIDSRSGRKTQYTAANGLGGDSAYAIACDRLGRVWVGTLNGGVSVFNGSSWSTYCGLNGLHGEHVIAIATSPIDGDIWMATESGLTRYSLARNSWSYYTTLNGLPSNEANALAFDKWGNLYLGTQCDGIAIGAAASNYQSWHVVPVDRGLPASRSGAGLPCAE